jgi:uncharacterized delta-60 repeat protein
MMSMYMKTRVLFIFTGLMFILGIAIGQDADSTDRLIVPPGVKLITLTSSDDVANEVILAPDGSMFVSGSRNSRFTLLKLKTDGSLDNSFGNGGIVLTDVRCGEDLYSCLLIQKGGKILQSGTAYNGKHNDFALLRYKPSGMVDSLFGKNGLITFHARGGNDIVTSLLTQANDRVLILGSSSDGNNDAFAMARMLPNGKRDTTFGNNGFVFNNIRAGDDVVCGAVNQPDGKFIVAGSSNTDFGVARYHFNGQIDKTFGTNGLTLTSIGGCEDIAMAIVIQNDGKVVVAGSTFNGDNFDFTLVRYTSRGFLDPTFGKGGMVVTAIGTGDDKIFDMVIQLDGKLVVGGSSFNGQSDDFALVRYNPDGSLDKSFGKGGIVVTEVQKGDEHIYSLAFQPDNKIVAAGNSNNGYNNDFAILRFMPDGSLDKTFGR